MTKSKSRHKILVMNTLWNLAGQVVPLLVAVMAIPFLVKGLGVERFGVLMLVLTFIGYFSIFDLGLGRALTKLVAEKLGNGCQDNIPGLVWTALALMLCLGIIGAIILGCLSPWLAHSALKIPKLIQREVFGSLILVAVTIPIVTSTIGLCGVLEAYQRFDLTNAVRIPMGLFTFLGPLLVVPFSHNLTYIVAVLMAGRMCSWIAHLWLCLHVVPALRKISVHRSSLRPLLSFGSWMTVTNIISPLMVYMDRFLISVLVSITAVAYYTIPQEVVIRLTVIPMAIVGVLFPAFSTYLAERRENAIVLFDRSVNYLFIIMFPISLLVVAQAKEALQLWLGSEFAQSSTGVLQWLTVGLFFNSLARISFAMIQAEGRPDLTAKLHLFELPIYLLLLWILLYKYGIRGAAIAWTLRMTIDMFLLFTFTYKHELVNVATIRRLFIMLCAGLIVFTLAAITSNLLLKTIFLVLVLVVFSLVTWFLILQRQERKSLMKLIKQIRLSFIISHHEANQ
jgi:O-antigen/teichoic acid export membrane protein